MVAIQLTGTALAADLEGLESFKHLPEKLQYFNADAFKDNPNVQSAILQKQSAECQFNIEKSKLCPTIDASIGANTSGSFIV